MCVHACVHLKDIKSLPFPVIKSHYIMHWQKQLCKDNHATCNPKEGWTYSHTGK